MGEIKEGEGGAELRPVTYLSIALAAALDNLDGDLDHLKVFFITEGVYGVEIAARGEEEPERYFQALPSRPDAQATPTPFGGTNVEGEHV